MSVTASTAKVQYTLVSASGALSVPFYFFENSHVRVIRTRANVETVLTTGFSLSGAGVPAGGTLTLDGTQTAIADRVTIKRNVPLTQLSTYVTNDRFPAATMERNLDVLTMLVQQASEKADRALAFGEGETFSPALSVVARASKVLGFSSTGAIEFTDPVTFAAPAQAAADAAALSETGAYASELSAAASATLASNQATDAADSATAAAASAVSAAAFAAFASTFLPTQTGNAGKLLSTNGTGASWVSSVAAFQIDALVVGSMQKTSVAYATGGAVGLRFDLGSYAYVGLTVNLTVTGSAGVVVGRTQTIDLTNTTGGTLTLAWPGSWQLLNGALPTSLAAGATIRVELNCTGTTEASIVAGYSVRLGTGIAAALAINAGTTGAPALLGAAGAFTTLSASGQATLSTTLLVGSGATLTGSGVEVQASNFQIIGRSSTTTRMMLAHDGTKGKIGTLDNQSFDFLVNNAIVGTVSSTGLNSTAIGATTPSTGAFTTLSAKGLLTVVRSDSNNSVQLDSETGEGHLISINPNSATLPAFLIQGRNNVPTTQTYATFTSTGLAVTGALSSDSLVKIGGTVNGNSGLQFDVSRSLSGVEWFGSVSGAGYGHRAIEDDSGAGFSRFKLQGRVNSASWTTVLQVDGTSGLAVTGVLSATGRIATLAGSNVTLTNARNDNLAIGTAGFFRFLGGGASAQVSGMVAGTDGQQITVFNATGSNIVFLYDDANSTAANRIYTDGGVSVTLGNAGALSFIYLAVSSRWVFLGKP
jgi:hypothetical protein